MAYTRQEFVDKQVLTHIHLNYIEAGIEEASEKIESHIGDLENPHGVTLEQLGVTVAAEDLNSLGESVASVQSQVDVLAGQIGIRNLLDNSDFTNPVNQRGATEYSGASVYSVDRWKVGNTATVGKVVIGENGVTLSSDEYCDFFQNLEHYAEMKGKKYTIAYMDGDGNIYVSPFTMGAHGGLTWIDFGKVKFMSVDAMNILFRVYETETIKWAALYEGEYTAETLPPYVPKGYIAEQLECRRYYRKYNKWNDIGSGYVTYSGGIYIPIPCDIRMRTTPTAVGNKFQVRCNGSVIDITATPTVTCYNNVIELFFANETVATSYGNRPCYISVANSTFELNANL